MDIEKLKKRCGYDGKPQQWQYGFDLACRELGKQPQWISVNDSLPDDSYGRVLAWVVGQNSLGSVGYAWNCDHNNGVFSDNFEVFHVTHWMPLPEPPTKECE